MANVSICTVSDDDTERDDFDMLLSWMFLWFESYVTRILSADGSVVRSFSEFASIFLPNSKLLVSKYFRPNWFLPLSSPEI